MKPQRPGWWLLDTEVGEYQQAGMQATYLVIEKGTELRCFLAVGVKLYSHLFTFRITKNTFGRLFCRNARQVLCASKEVMK